MRAILARLSAILLFGVALPIAAAPAASAQPLPGTTCPLFPADNILNADVSALPVHAQSQTWKGNMSQNTNLHPDLGTFAQWYGIPVNVAPPPSTGVTPTFTYNPESDHPAEGYPIDQSTFIEGGPAAPSGSDRHALVVNKNNCKLYEIFNLQNFTNGQIPQAGSGAVWDLSSNAMRPIGWTSADAAGLPITPLLLRPDEIQAGSITHAIRFTAHCTNSYIWPGSHNAGLCATGFPPMGARFRLRANFNVSAFGPSTQVVLRAFQHYGLILADNGADWFFGGTTDDWWGTTAGNQIVSDLKTIPAAQFDAVDETNMQATAGSYQALTSFPNPCATASLSTNPGSPQPAGTQVILTGSSTGCPNPRYQFWLQDPGSRWSMVQDYSATTTYTWAAANNRAPGVYHLQVYARDTSSSVTYDAVSPITNYQMNAGQACTAPTLSPSPVTPGATGATVTLTGGSSGCPNPRYRFWIQDPGRAWSMVQDYSPATTYTWTQTGLAGSYKMEVDVRDASESTVYDVVSNKTYILNGCSAAGISGNPASPTAHGTAITLTATATCPGTPTYKFWIKAPLGAWTVVQSYGTANTFSWTPTAAGTYYLEVDVRDQGATDTYEKVWNIPYSVT
jgi:hypothetical protein